MASIDDLIHQFKAGTVQERCEAAEKLSQLGSQAISATDALVAALSDFGEESVGGAGEGGAGGVTYFVREAAVRALARVNPAAAAPLAIKVMTELNGKPKGWHGWMDYYSEWHVSFSAEEIAAFGPAATEALSAPSSRPEVKEAEQITLPDRGGT